MEKAFPADVLCLCQSFFQSHGKLVTAGGGLETAGVAPQQLHNPGSFHTFYQLADALQISVATARKLNVCNYVTLNIESNIA